LTLSIHPHPSSIYGTCGQFVASPAVLGQPWVLTFPPNPNQYLSELYVNIGTSLGGNNVAVIENYQLSELNYFQYSFNDSYPFYYVEIQIYRKAPTRENQACLSTGVFGVEPNGPVQVLTSGLPAYQFGGQTPYYFVAFESSKSNIPFACVNDALQEFSPSGVYSSYQSGVYQYLVFCSVNSNYQGAVQSSTVGSASYFVGAVNFGPTNFNSQYYLYVHSKGTINFETIYTRSAYVSYNLSAQLTACTIKSTSSTEQFVKCPPPPTNPLGFILARFVFISTTGLQQEGWSQIILTSFK